MPTPQGDITSSQLWTQPEEEKQDDLFDVQGSGGDEQPAEDQGSDEASQEV
jgi:hypothetical protein